jgi:hypothetical protein
MGLFFFKDYFKKNNFKEHVKMINLSIFSI